MELDRRAEAAHRTLGSSVADRHNVRVLSGIVESVKAEGERMGEQDDYLTKERLNRVSMSQRACDDKAAASTNPGVRVRPWHPGALYQRDDYVRFTDGCWYLCRALTYKSLLEDQYSWRHIEGMIITK